MLFLRSEQMEQTAHFILQMLLGKQQCENHNIVKLMCERTVRIIHMAIEIWRGEALNLSVVTDSLMIYSLTTSVCKMLPLWYPDI